MIKIQHLTMFKQADNEHGFIQCVISPAFKKDFIDLGFVSSVDDFDYSDKQEDNETITDEELEELDRLEAAKAKAKELKLKGYGTMSLEKLEARIAEAEKENANN